MKCITLGLALLCASPPPASADDLQILIAQIEEAGINADDFERHAVTLEDCVMTTYVWRNTKNHGWVVWSSFHFNVSQVVLEPIGLNNATPYMYIPPEPGIPGVVTFGLKSRDNGLVRHERSNLRKPTPTDRTEPSPRGDGATHYFEWHNSFAIIMEGQTSEQKAKDFSLGYQRYAEEYCNYAG
ncbi:hypothetical protein MWU60_04455 [Yoonia sp. F2084L]|nr:hypothetical protein [Yoonia sp. F2084L]